jgi:DNA polymerase III subunit gamma/tau
MLCLILCHEALVHKQFLDIDLNILAYSRPLNDIILPVQESLYQPLFLKYRPQKLNDILGQDSVKETLINAINNEKIVHAYLLTGPRGSGKTSTARIIAKSLNCTNAADGKSPTTDPCGSCESCMSIANSSSVDVTEIDAASHGSVEDARYLIEKVSHASAAGKYRVYIIDEVHMLSKQAFNALLKVIEEPPKNVVFVLATTEFDKVLKTISSRCQQLRFKSITIQDVLKRMNHVCSEEKLNIDQDALEAIAKHSDGAMRDALALLDQIGVFSNDQNPVSKDKVLNIIGAVSTEDLEKLLSNLLLRDLGELISQVDKMISFGKEPLIITQELNSFILELLTNMSLGNNDLAPNLIKTIQEKEIENYELVQISSSLAELEIKLKLTTQTKALFKAWLVKLAHREDILIVKNLLERIKRLEAGGVIAPSSVPRQTPAIKAKPATVMPAEKVVQVKPYEDKPSPVEQVASVNRDIDTENPAPAVSSGFLNHLSPGSKGMFISSKAALTSFSAPTAVVSIPTKFKFLKSKLEARSDEFLKAIAKEHGADITNLNFELTDSTSPAEPIVEKKTPEIENLNPSPHNPVDKEPKAEKKIVEERSQGESCAVRDEQVQDVTPATYNRDKLDEVREAAVNIFGGKVL